MIANVVGIEQKPLKISQKRFFINFPFMENGNELIFLQPTLLEDLTRIE